MAVKPTATETNKPQPMPTAARPQKAPRWGALPMRTQYAEAAAHRRIHQMPWTPPRMKKLFASESGSSKYHLSLKSSPPPPPPNLPPPPWPPPPPVWV